MNKCIRLVINENGNDPSGSTKSRNCLAEELNKHSHPWN